MVFEFRLPDIGEGVAEGEVVRWFVKAGDTVREDDPLVSVLTDKANVEIPSPKSGRVLSLHAQVGEKVKVGGLLVTIEAEGAASPSPSRPAPTPAVPPAGATPVPSTPPGGTSAERVSTTPSSILATPGVRRRAAELGVDLSRVKGSGPGGRIVDSDLDATKSESAAPTSSPMWPALFRSRNVGFESSRESHSTASQFGRHS